MMKPHFLFLFISLFLVSFFTGQSAFAQSGESGAITPPVVQNEPVAVPMPSAAPEIPLRCWGCVTGKSTCPQGEVCTKEHDCKDCNCNFVPKNFAVTPATRKHCTTIFEDAETPIGCYCIYCNY